MVYKTNESIIVIQAEATNPNRTDVVFWSHDRGTAKLRMKLVRKNGIPQSLPEGTTVPIRLMFRSATAEGGYGKHDYLATIEDRVNGIVSIVLEDNILGYVGIVEGSVYIDFPNDQSLDTAGRFTFDIKRSPIDDSTPELEDYYFNGFSQTIDKIEQIVSNAKTEIDTKVAGTKKEFDTEVEKIKTSIGEANQSLTTLNGDMTALSEKITEADQHFINKESVEVGPLIFKNTTITTQDWNNITESGVYYCAGSSGINAPYTGKLYGLLTVYSEQAVTIQKYEFQNSIYMRTFAGNPAAWGNWKKVALSSEVMNLTDPQTALGVKNFSDGIQIAGDRVVGENEHVVYTLDASNSKSFIDGYATFIKHGKTVIANGTVKLKKAYPFGTTLEDVLPDEFVAKIVHGMLTGPSGTSSVSKAMYVRKDLGTIITNSEFAANEWFTFHGNYWVGEE